MFNVYGLFALVTVSAILIITVRRHNPEHALAITLGCACVTAVFLLSQITEVVAQMTEIANMAMIDGLDSLYKAIGISMVGQIMADVCADYGQTSLSGVISMAGRVAIVIISLPLFKELLNVAVALIKA